MLSWQVGTFFVSACRVLARLRPCECSYEYDLRKKVTEQGTQGQCFVPREDARSWLVSVGWELLKDIQFVNFLVLFEWSKRFIYAIISSYQLRWQLWNMNIVRSIYQKKINSRVSTRRVYGMPTSEVIRVTIGLNPHTSPFKVMVTFEAWSSIDMFAFVFLAIRPFFPRYSKFHIWPWKFKVKPDDPIWGLAFNRYVCFLFRGNRTILAGPTIPKIWQIECSIRDRRILNFTKKIIEIFSGRIPPKFNLVESMTRGIYLPRFEAVGWTVCTL